MDCSQKEGWNGSEGVRETGRRRRGRVGRREREGEREREGGYTYTSRCESSQRAGITVSCILSARLLWQPKLFLGKEKDREMRDTRWMNRGGGEEWRIGGKFETKRNADRERTKAFTVDRALPQLPPLFGSNRFVLFWDNVDEVLLRGSVSIDNLQNSLLVAIDKFSC